VLRLEDGRRDKNGQSAGEKGTTLHHSPSRGRWTGFTHFATRAAGAREGERTGSGAAGARRVNGNRPRVVRPPSPAFGS
jgi:hypothetical protein